MASSLDDIEQQIAELQEKKRELYHEELMQLETEVKPVLKRIEWLRKRIGVPQSGARGSRSDVLLELTADGEVHTLRELVSHFENEGATRTAVNRMLRKGILKYEGRGKVRRVV